MMRKILYGLFMASAITASAQLTIPHDFDTGSIIPGTPTVTTFNIPQFNPSLGTLQKVTFSYRLDSWGGSFEVENITDPSEPVSGNMQLGITSTLSGLLVPAGMASLFAGESKAFNLPNTGDTDSLLGNDYDNRYQDGPESGVKTTELNPYIGTGTYAVDFNSMQSSSHTASGGVRGEFVSANSQGFLTVTYEYIPEPTIVAFSALGGALFLLRRRLQRNRVPAA